MSGYAEVYKAHDGWRWRLLGDNHEVIATGEAYTRRNTAVRGLRRVNKDVEIRMVPSANVPT